MICFLPILEDLDIGHLWLNFDDPTSQPSTLPPLTGTLTLSQAQVTKQITRPLINLRICARFRRLHYTWWLREGLWRMEALVGACSGTLERVYIEDSAWGKLLSLNS